MNGTYDPWLVILSIGVAVLASYVALDLASRVSASQGTRTARYWLDGGAISMGIGIWSMHFIGMLAFNLPIPMSYDISITLLSLLVAMIVSGFALYTVSRGTLQVTRLLVAGLFMGMGIAAMHYTGMAAMQMQPPVNYTPLLFAASILIAIVASIVALWIAFQLRAETIFSAFWKKFGSALVMGAAIAGMHYTGMAAANFAADSICTVDSQNINNAWLAGTIGGFTFLFLTGTLLISVFDARLASHSAKSAESLRKANIDLEMRSAQLARANEVLRQEGLERMQAEIALRHSEERLRAAFNQSAVGIVHTSLDGTILQINRKLCEILGYSSVELQAQKLTDITHPEDPSNSRDSRRELLAGMTQSKSPTTEKRLVRKDGSTVWTIISTSLVRKPSGEPDYFVALFQDISEHKKAQEQLNYLAQYDTLTGLPNRNLFRDRLTLAIARAKREDKLVGAISLGLDHFKVINDTLGYSTGDEVLKAAAALLRNSLRDSDTVSRFGGDLFAVILEDIAHVDQVTTAAEKIKQAFSEPIVIKDRAVLVTISAGITIYPLGGEEIDVLLQMADAAMYHAKKMGRDTYEFYSPDLNAKAGERLKMQTLLRGAIERKEFVLHYQPKVESAGGKLAGVEALIRWNSRELGLVPPIRFIPLAEDTGLIVTIGEWVLRTACAQSMAWQAQGAAPSLMSVNLSPRQLRQKNLVEMIAGILEETGLAPQLLELEITESLIMENVEENIAKLSAIRDLGVSLAIDDFGTGYSSLGYLARLPVQTLKIDRSFIVKMQDDAQAMTLVSTILTLARSLGLKVVAEGVETEAQAKVLRLLRCDQLQGYLISKPVPAAELFAFVGQG